MPSDWYVSSYRRCGEALCFIFRVCRSKNSVAGQLDPKSWGNTLLRNVGNYFTLTRFDIPDALNLHQRRLCKPQILRQKLQFRLL